MNRREVIAAMASAAVLGGAPASLASAADRGPWERAIAAMQDACRAFNDEPFDSPRSDALGDAMCEAEGAMLATPAPDEAALLFKLEFLFGDDARGSDDSSAAWCAEWINPVMADAHRLLWNGRA